MDLDLLRWKGVDWSAGVKFQVAHFGIDKKELKMRGTIPNFANEKEPKRNFLVLGRKT